MQCRYRAEFDEAAKHNEILGANLGKVGAGSWGLDGLGCLPGTCRAPCRSGWRAAQSAALTPATLSTHKRGARHPWLGARRASPLALALSLPARWSMTCTPCACCSSSPPSPRR